MRAEWEVLRIALVHRLGVTAVEEASVVIAVSSVHRKDSLEAVEYAINTLKATVPIWKLVSVCACFYFFYLCVLCCYFVSDVLSII